MLFGLHIVFFVLLSIRVREELHLSGSSTAWVIGCILKWSLLNFKQANYVLAAKAGSAALAWWLCPARWRVCECVAAHSLVLLLVGPSLLRHRARQVEKELAWAEQGNAWQHAAILYLLIHTVNICQCRVWCVTIGYTPQLSAVVIMTLMVISVWAVQLCFW